MGNYFNINFEFDKKRVQERIDETVMSDDKGYICVAEGSIMINVDRDLAYRKVVNEAMFSISDSSWIPVYIRWIYGIKYQSYPGPDMFMDIIRMKKYRMLFLGTSNEILHPLKSELTKIDPKIEQMQFVELPFCKVEEFDYNEIANMVNQDNPDIIWVALGAPKQEIFMHNLLEKINRGVMVGVGAAFLMYSGVEGTKRAPKWMRKMKMEFMYRIFQNPRKQLRRFLWGLPKIPKILIKEVKQK